MTSCEDHAGLDAVILKCCDQGTKSVRRPLNTQMPAGVATTHALIPRRSSQISCRAPTAVATASIRARTKKLRPGPTMAATASKAYPNAPTVISARTTTRAPLLTSNLTAPGPHSSAGSIANSHRQRACTALSMSSSDDRRAFLTHSSVGKRALAFPFLGQLRYGGERSRPGRCALGSSRYSANYRTRAAGVVNEIGSAIPTVIRHLPPSRITLNASCTAGIATVVNTTYPSSPARRTSFTLATVNWGRSLPFALVFVSTSPRRLPQLCSIAPLFALAY